MIDTTPDGTAVVVGSDDSKLAQDTLNALQAMSMNMDILQNEYLGPLNDRQKKQLTIAAHQRELIRESLVDLRELERLVVLRMQGAMQMAPFDIQQLAQEAVHDLAPRFSARDLTCVAVMDEVKEALGDCRAMRRVIDNLVLHAIQVAPAGGRIEVRLHQQGDNLFFGVNDGGPGIDEKDHSRLFDPFYQPVSTANALSPIGLGLAVVKEVVALHKGKIHIVSTPQTGTTLTIEVPSVLRQKEFLAFVE